MNAMKRVLMWLGAFIVIGWTFQIFFRVLVMGMQGRL